MYPESLFIKIFDTLLIDNELNHEYFHGLEENISGSNGNLWCNPKNPVKGQVKHRFLSLYKHTQNK